MQEEYVAAEEFPPGDHLRDELAERRWTVTEFAEILGRPVQAVSEILNGKKSITAQTACELSDAFGTSANVWLGLQNSYDLYLLRSRKVPENPSRITRLAQLRDLIPLAEARGRGWIPDTDDIDELERAVCELLEMPSPQDKCGLFAAARYPVPDEDWDRHQVPADNQIPWLGRVRQMAAAQNVAPFSADDVRDLAARLPRLMRDGPEPLTQVPELMNKCGVAVVFLKGLRRDRIDGSASVLADERRVIGLTTREDRLDRTLCALLHQCAHIVLGHLETASGASRIPMCDMISSDHRTSVIDRAAEAQVAKWLFPGGFSCESTEAHSIEECAARYEVHPSVVIGRLQHQSQRGAKSRKHVPRVNPELEAAGLLAS